MAYLSKYEDIKNKQTKTHGTHCWLNVSHFLADMLILL